MTNHKQTYLDGLKNILDKIEIDGRKLINKVEDEYDESLYLHAMKQLYNHIFAIIEIEFDVDLE